MMKENIINSDSFLFTINEAKTLLRISRTKLVNDYITPGKLPVILMEDGRKMIRHGDLKAYLGERKREYYN
ncbi:MAG: helix-turn-helix domain-containing protein [Candidatus Roizmanbacteria bacterium]|nr:helix-turn-helix domain-containing protein [Candidatus Roizmanbacteria bacterium]